MRFRGIRVRGLGPFRDEVVVDLEDLEGQLVAVTGPNGAGKSTLLELLVGALYRRTPTRGSLRELATRRDAFVEVLVDDLRVRQSVDAVSGKGEALLERRAEVGLYPGEGPGELLVESGKVRDADAWVAAHLPPEALVLVSTFGVQGSAGFAGLSTGDRKAILLRALGLERLEALAKLARKRYTTAFSGFQVLDARIVDARALVDDELEQPLRDARAALPDLEVAVEQAREVLDRARARGELRLELERRRQELEALRRQRGELEALVSSRASIESAAAEIAELGGRIAAAEGELASSRAKIEELAEGRLEARQAWETARAEVVEAQGELDELRVMATTRERLEERPVQLAEAEVELEAASKHAALAQVAVDEARALAGDVHRKRAARLHGHLDAVRLDTRPEVLPERAEGLRGVIDEVHEHVVEGLQDDLERERTHAQAAEELPRLEAARTAADEALRRLEGRLRGLQADVGRLEVLSTVPERLEAVQGRLEAAQGRVAVARQRGEVLVDRKRAHESRIGELEEQIRTLRGNVAELAVLGGRLAELEQAAGRVEELERGITRGLEAAEAAEAALEAAQAAPEVPEAEQALRAAEGAIADARRELGRLEARVEQSVAAAERAAELEAERPELELEVADWSLLARSLGREGLQAALVDAAGPELTELVNDLLHSCVGPRWSVEVRTQRSKASGPGELEVLDLHVVDTVEGREGEISTFSGGERVILGEAVALALTTLARRRAGIPPGATIVRDESGAALDPERAEQWIAMVRRAAEHVGAAQVLLVTHNPRAAELCDVQLRVADRTVEVVV